MAEYIDKKAAIADLNETYDKMAGFHAQFYNGYQVAVNRLRVFPAAEVEPVRHGRWEWLGPNSLVRECACGTCSACKVRSKYIVNKDICPNCGARMDGGADNG